jgi:hypothetical protein
MKKLIAPFVLIALLGCSNFAANTFRTEQVLTGAAYTAYQGYTNALYNGSLRISSTDSNAVKNARLEFAASIDALELWRETYATNSAAKPQVQSALDAAILNSSNLVNLINLIKNK